ncbi:MAG: ribonucleotide-diphosphate reductase subunit beta, partial [Dechloromonas sp.]|nr:ribonucleotide-diphosphate reductase subunit beta [Dechloromonas sp.]
MSILFDDWDLPSPANSHASGTAKTPAVSAGPDAPTASLPAASTSPAAPAQPVSTATSVGSPALAPVNAADKRIVNGKADINQLAPFKYPWAWEFFLKANRNHWTPLEIGMAQDVHDYHHKLSPAERHVFENVLAYLTTSDILAMRNIG